MVGRASRCVCLLAAALLSAGELALDATATIEGGATEGDTTSLVPPQQPSPVLMLHDLFRPGDSLVPIISSPQNGTTVFGWTLVKVDLALLLPEGVNTDPDLSGIDVCLEVDSARIQCVGLASTAAQALYLQGMTPRSSPFRLKARLVNASTRETTGWSSVMFFVKPSQAEVGEEGQNFPFIAHLPHQPPPMTTQHLAQTPLPPIRTLHQLAEFARRRADLFARVERLKAVPKPAMVDGAGIVIVAGGAKYLLNAWLTIRSVRRLGSVLPIEVWHDGEAELPGAWRVWLEREPGVRCRDLDAELKSTRRAQPLLPDLPPGRRYFLKPFALLLTGFR